MRMKIENRINSSNNQKPSNNRLQKYSLGSQSLAVLAGIMGQITISSAAIRVLDVGALTNGQTINTAVPNTMLSLNFSETASSDSLTFGGDPSFGGLLNLAGSGGASVLYNSGNIYSPKYFAVGSSVDSSSSENTETNYFTYGGGNYGDWTVDRPSGAIGFKNGDGEFGYMLVSWVAATNTLTFLGVGAFDDVPGTAITVVPEPSEYAAALGLGALGLACYRRRPGNKSRSKV